MLTVDWKGGMAFESNPPSQNRFVMDATPDAGGQNLGPTPVEALISSIAACSAMDVISILTKKKQEVSSYQIKVDWTRGPEGEWPRPVRSVVIKHMLQGANLDPVAVERAVSLSHDKYCTVIATLRESAEIHSTFEVK